LDGSIAAAPRFGIPATRLAEEVGRRLVLNIVMVGFFAAMTDVVRTEAIRQSVEVSVPAGTEALNLAAFQKGYEHGVALGRQARA
jgi:2-oxoglutarate ferredoxin oxidoreductase subunit gamma